MRRAASLTLWGLLLLLTLATLAAQPQAFAPKPFIGWRNLMVQWTGVLAYGVMSVAMLLALRPKWPEKWFGGLDKMYRLHRSLGIAGLILATTHWLWGQAPKWARSLGLLQGGRPPRRGPPPGQEGDLLAWLQSQRHLAETIGEWSFYAAVVLILVALVSRIPYRWFLRTHRVFPLVFLALSFHALVLLDRKSWPTVLGPLMGLLILGGALSAFVLLYRQWFPRGLKAHLSEVRPYPELRVYETRLALEPGWPGHKAGQFAFVTLDRNEGAHPFTLASSWHEGLNELTVIAKELGDYTRRLGRELQPGRSALIEGPYGCFTFDDYAPLQIWVGGGIGITPFVGRMKQLASASHRAQRIVLFHTTADYSPAAIARLQDDAQAAGVELHVLHDARDGLLSGEKIRALVPDWASASIWFCGPPAFADTLKNDFAQVGFDIRRRFHQELFRWR